MTKSSLKYQWCTSAFLAAAAASMMAVMPSRAMALGELHPAVEAAEAQRIAAMKKATPAVLAIFAEGGQGGGSGVVISPDGYALSNFHVVKPCGNVMKCGMSDGKLYDAVVVGLDATGDVGLIKLLGRDDFPAATMADSEKTRVGDWCFAMGNPFLLANDFQPTVTFGVVSGIHRYQPPDGTILEYADCIQVDASINPGNSGGPLFNADGDLIGINGRGSFEKRGRVNVGVGYAITINQIKNFLGCLKSGRIIDHATLGAVVTSDDKGRVTVNDILEDSDAFRRGLRYDDEIINFGGRSIQTVNSFKNVLGTYPKGWRVPLSFRQDGKRQEVLVRLAGVHRAGELEEKISGRTPDPNKPRRKPDEPQPDKQPGPDKEPSDKEPKQDQPEDSSPHGRSREIPEIAKAHFEARPGYVNYVFNKLHRDRVRKVMEGRGDFAELRGLWTLTGEMAGGGEIQFRLGADTATIKLTGGEATLPSTDTLGDDLNPPNSGGLLAAMYLWRRFLTESPDGYGLVYYFGTAPLAGRSELVDVLVGTHGGVDTWFYVDPNDGTLLALEMYSDENADPCEVHFADYREVEGRFLPYRIQVRFGDHPYGIFLFKELELRKDG